MEQGEDDFWPKAGIGAAVMGTQRCCCTWRERGRAVIGSRQSYRWNELGASLGEDAEMIPAARGQGKVGRDGLGFCPKSLIFGTIWESP